MKRILYIGVALCALFAAGCGGSISNGGNNPLTGSYRSQFNRGITIASMIVATVEGDGTTEIVVSDVNGVQYSGIGLATTSTNLTATLNQKGGAGVVNVTGTFIGQSIPTLRLTLSGAINQIVDLQKFANLSTSPFTGPLSVTTAGDEVGTATITVAADGSITGTAHSPAGGNFPVVGAVDSLGVVTFHGTGNISGTATEFNYTGDLFLKPTSNIDVAGEGVWEKNSVDAGTWTAD